MINVNVNNPSMLRATGMQVLADSLGPVGFARFIQQFENGYGDYTKERTTITASSFDDLDAELKKYL